MRIVCGLRRLVPALALLVFSVGAAGAETIVNKKTSYFQIGGRTAADLDRELERRGPYTNSTGNRHPGATKIKFGGDITYVEHPGRCAVQSARVTLNVHIILPRWTNRKRAGKDLGLIWDTLSRDIKRHEERHAEIARQHAKGLEKALVALRPRASCEQVQDAVDRLTQDAIDAHDRDQNRFDQIEAVNFEKRIIRMLESSARAN